MTRKVYYTEKGRQFTSLYSYSLDTSSTIIKKKI